MLNFTIVSVSDSPAPRREQRPGSLHPRSRLQSPGWEIPEAGQPLLDWPGLHEGYRFQFNITPDTRVQPAPPILNNNNNWILIIIIVSILFAVIAAIYMFF